MYVSEAALYPVITANGVGEGAEILKLPLKAPQARQQPFHCYVAMDFYSRSNYMRENSVRTELIQHPNIVLLTVIAFVLLVSILLKTLL